ncbi:oxidoreductase [Mechercharimyces sp. CAU 1602]|uniref:oxidoreductase n=1 Tax=Mechercharimyces sp. CAU 1602 TaxID=2973933 RepID=UPI002163575F|nr:oxidoreductase [Mechercharimyces sp. CAU 1602]MCS1350272.1 oxidoreductase [Mechercharimyces sp. CAU 1602]
MSTLATRKSALIAGSTGLIGHHVMQTLIAHPQYKEVRVITRRPLPIEDPKVQVIQVDFAHLQDYKECFQVDEIYCCLGTTMKKAKTKEAFRQVDYKYPLQLAQLGKEMNTKRYLLVSSMGADPSSRFFYNQVKGELEQALEALHLPATHIFRPSLLLGKREEFRLGEEIGGLLAKGLGFAFQGPLKKYRPIQGETVAQAMVHTAQLDRTGTHHYLSNEIAEIVASEITNQ